MTPEQKKTLIVLLGTGFVVGWSLESMKQRRKKRLEDEYRRAMTRRAFRLLGADLRTQQQILENYFNDPFATPKIDAETNAAFEEIVSHFND